MQIGDLKTLPTFIQALHADGPAIFDADQPLGVLNN